jgi:hypothetical protein
MNLENDVSHSIGNDSLADPPTPSPETSARDGGVTRRVIVLCLTLALLFGYFVPIINLKMSQSIAGAGAGLPSGAVGVLLLLLALNPWLKKIGRKWVLSRNEMLTVYICSSFTVLVPSMGNEGNIVQILIGPFYYATQSNRWLQWLEPYLKPWLSPALDASGHYSAAGQKLTEAWFLGNGGQVPWGAWLMPLLIWSTYVLMTYVMLGCLAVMLRAQWAEKEALRFPLLQLPLEMTEDKGVSAFWSNPTMWYGFVLVAFIQLVRGLHRYFPDMPDIPLEIGLGSILTENPWNQLGIFSLGISPLALGIAYLLTCEVSFSLWFFYWFIKAQYLVAYYSGYPPASLPEMGGWWETSFTGYQIIGATFAIVAFALWTAREHLGHVTRRAFGRAASTPEESIGPLSYPLAFWGFFLSLSFLIAWSVAIGVQWLPALLFWMGFLITTIATARLLAEAGLGSSNWVPLSVMEYMGGTGPGTWLSASTLMPSTMLMQTSSGWMLPSFLYSFKLAGLCKIHMRRLLALIAVTTIVALVSATAMKVYLGYAYGGLQLNAWHVNTMPKIVMWDVAGWSDPRSPDSWTKWFWIGLGTLLTWGMMLARTTWSWFPLHPLGFLVASKFGSMSSWWCSVLLGWLCKTTITKFGGNDAYRAAIPFFMGIVLGDVALLLFWTAIDIWQARA